MAIDHVSTDTTADAGAGATIVLTLPTGLTSSNVCILTLASADPSAGVGDFTAPSGWTSINTQITQFAGGGVGVHMWWCLGNNANLTFTKSGAVTWYGATIAAFSGVNTTTPIDATGTQNSNTGASSLTVNSVTIATNNAWEIFGCADWLDGTFTATGFTVSQTFGASGACCGLLYNQTPKSTGSTGTVTLNDSAGTSGQLIIASPFALRPTSSGVAATPDLYSLMGQGWI